MTTSDHLHAGHSDVTDRPSYDDVNTSAVFLVGIISAIVTILIISVVQGLCYHWQSSVAIEHNRKYAGKLVKPILDAQKKQLEGGGGVLSISEAMERVRKQYGQSTSEARSDVPKSGN